jgi:trans-2,3-dihydro-3-hydroxyanthranilate isomerase
MTLEFRTLDVFTTRRFGGNPLAVVFDPDAALDTGRMQAIAREFNLSETTFVRPPRDRANDAEVRIFTPAMEMPWAGHPNVGTAWALALRESPATSRRYRFEELAGVVEVDVTADAGRLIDARVTAPKPLARQPAPSAEAMARCLGLELADLRLDRHAPVAVSVGFAFPVVELVSRTVLGRANGNREAMAQLLPPLGLGGVVAYSRETSDADDFDGRSSDISTRMFAPLMGVVEDPATGAAMAALAAWLAQLDADRSEASMATQRLRIAQGVDMGRPSLLITEVALADARVTRTSIGGACIGVMQGRIDVD